MVNLIDKDALVSEIKARISDIEVSQKAGLIKKRDANKKIIIFKSILSLIDTLEVKEIGVDLGDPKGDRSARYIIDTKNLKEKEVDLDFVKEVDVWIEDNGDSNGFFNVQDLAKHFFELGLKAQKGE